MSIHQGSLADFLQGAKTLIENAATVSEISSALALYGYDGARLEEGRKLWSETDALVKKQSLDLGGRFEATQEFDKAWTRTFMARNGIKGTPKFKVFSDLSDAYRYPRIRIDLLWLVWCLLGYGNLLCYVE